MHATDEEAEKRKRRRKGGAVEGRAAKARLDRRAKGGGVTRSTFNAAINDNPARPTFDEPNALPAVHTRARGGKWIAGAIKHPGALHRELGVPEGKKIPEKKLKAAEHSSNPVERRRANLAETLKKLSH